VNMAAGGTLEAYLEAALAGAVAEVREAVPGSRNGAAFKQACALGGLLCHGLPRAHVEASLVAAAMSVGLTDTEARGAVRSGLNKGARNPRELPRTVHTRALGGGGRPTRRSTPAIAPAEVPAPPAPVDEVHASEARDVWDRAVYWDADLRAWLESRGLDPLALWRRDVIRALPAGPLPGWCAHWRGRAVLPVYDHTGELVTLRGRLVVPGAGVKTLSPKGVTLGGRVYACPWARRLLAGEIDDVAGVVVTEGDPDFLTLAGWWLEWERVAVIGVWSGALSAALLDRIPAGTNVLLCPHRDESKAGATMMRKAAGPLRRAGCRVWSLPYDGTRDVNDSLTIGNLEARLMASEVTE
jgi:hypothetical protein